MDETKTNFRVERDLAERIRNKYSDFKIDVTEFNFGPNRIQVHSKIYNEYLRIPEEEAKKVFLGLCTAFTSICYKFKIPLISLNILVLTDEDVNRGLQVTVQEENGTLCGYIFISPDYLMTGPGGFWVYTFLHEVGHCWLSGERPKADSTLLPNYELFVDLVAICALKEIIPLHRRQFRDIVRNSSYAGKESEIKKRVLNDPESVLREAMGTTNVKGGDHDEKEREGEGGSEG